MATSLKMPTVGIIANPKKEGGRRLLRELLDQFEQKGVSVCLEETTASLIDRSDGVGLSQLNDEVDLLVVLGGDGTILWVVRQLEGRIKPVAAINVGTLGFLTCGTADDSGDLVEAIANGRYKVSERVGISCKLHQQGVETGSFFALNEVTLSRANTSRVIHVEAVIDGQFANRYTGDGVLLATPTGSTAYSLSAGGPLVEPGSTVFILTPICPHTLANRPLVLSAKSKVSLQIPEQRDDLAMMIDGQLVANLDGRATIEIERTPNSIQLIFLESQNFFGTLHQKLGWTGSSIRNSE